MAYSARLRKAVGSVRSTLNTFGLEVQSPEFRTHGDHEIPADAPLVLVACSGGRDSMALAAVARTVCASMGVRCGAVIIDHAMQAGSDHVARQTAERCRNMGLDPVHIRTVNVLQHGEGTEAAAREARYRALAAVARETRAAAILLAHTMDDQAETVLIGLLRSRGVDALAGMPASIRREGVAFLRPLLGLTRADTTGICADLGLAYWDDPTNGESVDGELSSDYPLRSRVRHDLLPAIARFAGSDVTRHFAQSARLARLDKEYLDQQADELLAAAVTMTMPDASPVPAAEVKTEDASKQPAVGLTIDVRPLGQAHAAIRLRVIAHALTQAGISASSTQIEAIDRLITDWHGQGAVALSGEYSANRKKHVIRVCQDGTHANR